MMKWEQDKLVKDEKGRLNQAMYRLRQAIEPNIKKPIYLLTVPRKGFRLVRKP
jgi:DNA-binding winged helix-turn-helix (wHTH) protein